MHIWRRITFDRHTEFYATSFKWYYHNQPQKITTFTHNAQIDYYDDFFFFPKISYDWKNTAAILNLKKMQILLKFFLFFNFQLMMLLDIILLLYSMEIAFGWDHYHYVNQFTKKMLQMNRS